jgi:hypothetical protein
MAAAAIVALAAALRIVAPAAMGVRFDEIRIPNGSGSPSMPGRQRALVVMSHGGG